MSPNTTDTLTGARDALELWAWRAFGGAKSWNDLNLTLARTLGDKLCALGRDLQQCRTPADWAGASTQAAMQCAALYANYCSDLAALAANGLTPPAE